jgi:ElaB/YqjD/DUF883 family membrane-anchored ribosome-binding protein
MNTIERNQPAEMERPSTRAGQRIRETAGQLGETAARAGEGLEKRLDNLEVKFNDVRASVVDKTKEYSRTANDYVRKNPWVAVGVSAGLAFLAGMLIGRRRGG